MRKLVLMLMLAFTASTAFGQFFTLGPKFGISSSTLQIKDVASIVTGESSVGFHAGLFSRITIAGFYLQPELTLTSTGGEIRYTENVGGNLNQVAKLKYNKLDLPIMVGMKFIKILRVNAGPSFSLVMNEDVREDGVADNVKSNYNKSTVGYQAGVGLDIGNLTLDLRYEGNLNNLSDEINIGNESFNTDMRNNQWLVSVGFKLF